MYRLAKAIDSYSDPRTCYCQRGGPASAWNLLLGERVVTLSAISDIVKRDVGLKTQFSSSRHDTAPSDEADVSVDECIVEIGIERLRESVEANPLSPQS